jgi:hypothetical protein
MKQIFAWVLILITFIGVSGCKSKHEAAISDRLSYVKKLTAVLQGVKDEASAKAAVPKIEAIAKDMKALMEDMEKMGEPSKEEMEKLTKKYKSDAEKAGLDLMKEMARISTDPKLAAVLGGAMKNLKF